MTAALAAKMSSEHFWHTSRPVAVSTRSLVGCPHSSHDPALNSMPALRVGNQFDRGPWNERGIDTSARPCGGGRHRARSGLSGSATCGARCTESTVTRNLLRGRTRRGRAAADPSWIAGTALGWPSPDRTYPAIIVEGGRVAIMEESPGRRQRGSPIPGSPSSTRGPGRRDRPPGCRGSRRMTGTA
ncbi:MAG: hypothetical protein QOF96_1480 [Actinomycetota bacterium]|nr:hypothetical protein [Actinomycetota bacterium]